MTESMSVMDAFGEFNPDKVSPTEGETVYQKLYHVTGWDDVTDLAPGDAFTFKPGVHNAQGEGVYFSEDLPRMSAAEGAKGDPKAIIEIVAGDNNGWYLSKKENVKKYGKPRTWHTQGKSIRLVVIARNMVEFQGKEVPVFHCVWRWVGSEEEPLPEISKD